MKKLYPMTMVIGVVLSVLYRIILRKRKAKVVEDQVVAKEYDGTPVAPTW
jgi:hypothetical protein